MDDDDDDKEADMEIRPRVQRRTARESMQGIVSVSAEDDGGICRMRWSKKQGWWIKEPYLALLEAKKAFESIRVDDKTGNHLSVVSNNNLAQYLGEAVVAWKEAEGRLGNKYICPNHPFQDNHSDFDTVPDMTLALQHPPYRSNKHIYPLHPFPLWPRL